MTHAECRARNARILADIAAGQNITKHLAKKYGVSRSLIYDIAAEGTLACYVRPKGTALSIIAALQNTKDSYRKIAETIGVSKQRVGQIADEARTSGIVLPERAPNGKK